MSESRIENLRIKSQQLLITPKALQTEIPRSELASQTVINGRQQVKDILDRKDKRLVIVVGPCSIHDLKAAKEYAQRLKTLSKEVEGSLLLVMRVYFEKPRTTVGWKGLINDPYMDDSFKIEEGLHIARQLLLELNEMGLPCSTEALDPITPQYLQDLIAWSAIGARTTESQTHREMSSGLSCAVGFKNGTDGGLQVATNALLSVEHPHNFLGISKEGQVSIIETMGNPHAHIVLRGGGGKANYDSVSVALCESELSNAGLSETIMIDCSHANSNKDASLQVPVLENIGSQIFEGNKSIIGVMLESNLEFGNQSIPKNLSELKYGVSVTDACIDWKQTEDAIRALHEKIKDILPER
jgi:3-deoxy-7-phosphoheptulonate synthase